MSAGNPFKVEVLFSGMILFVRKPDSRMITHVLMRDGRGMPNLDRHTPYFCASNFRVELDRDRVTFDWLDAAGDTLQVNSFAADSKGRPNDLLGLPSPPADPANFFWTPNMSELGVPALVDMRCLQPSNPSATVVAQVVLNQGVLRTGDLAFADDQGEEWIARMNFRAGTGAAQLERAASEKVIWELPAPQGAATLLITLSKLDTHGAGVSSETQYKFPLSNTPVRLTLSNNPPLQANPPRGPGDKAMHFAFLYDLLVDPTTRQPYSGPRYLPVVPDRLWPHDDVPGTGPERNALLYKERLLGFADCHYCKQADGGCDCAELPLGRTKGTKLRPICIPATAYSESTDQVLSQEVKTQGISSRDPRPFDGIENRNAKFVVLEVFAGDNDLNDRIYEDLHEARNGMSGADGSVALLALVDRVRGSSQVVEVTEDGISKISKPGELDVGDPQVLASFIARGLVSYSARTRFAIGFWGHGSGVFDETDVKEKILGRLGPFRLWLGPASSPQAGQLLAGIYDLESFKTESLLTDSTPRSILTTREAGSMLASAFASAQRKAPVDMIFSDSCLNGMVEVFQELQPYAEVLVGSEDNEPDSGWDYQAWMRKTTTSPPTDSAAWGRQAVEAYGESYGAKFKKAPKTSQPCTLGAFRSQTEVMNEFKLLVDAIQKEQEGFKWMVAARDSCQAFDRRDSYDILSFASKLGGIAGSEGVKQAAAQLVKVFRAAQVDSVNLGDEVQDAHGLAFWFPSNRRFFRDIEATYQGLSFAQGTGWHAYLAKNLS